VLQPLRNERAEVGQRITLECEIPAHPEPDQVRWYRNEVFLELSADYQPSYRDGVCTLTIPRVGPQHAGQYSCVVVIRGVPNSTNMHLEVYAAPPPPQPVRLSVSVCVCVCVCVCVYKKVKVAHTRLPSAWFRS